MTVPVFVGYNIVAIVNEAVMYPALPIPSIILKSIENNTNSK